MEMLFQQINFILSAKNIKIVEDAAESLGSRYLKGKFKNKHTGTIGEMGAVSLMEIRL